MKFKAEMGHWSSVVGNSVHLIGEDGRFLGQIAIMCQDDRLREKDVQSELCEKICAALNADLSASEQQVRALDPRIYRLNAEALAEIKATVDGESDQDVGHIIYGLLDEIAALTPAPQPEANENYGDPVSSAPQAEAMEPKRNGEPKPTGWFEFDENTGEFTGEWCVVEPANSKGFRPLFAHPHQPSETVAEALLQRAVDLIKGDLTGSEWKRACNAFVKDALRALKGCA